MEYIVSWWSDETKQHIVCKDKETVEEKRRVIQVRSAASQRVSLEPIRVMPLVVFKKMEELRKTTPSSWLGRCRHSAYKRLCITCVGIEVL